MSHGDMQDERYEADEAARSPEPGTITREEMLLTRARKALSECNWTVGECASQWTELYARGRTDREFGELVGLSADQVYQRRRVWERWKEEYSCRHLLTWSHYYAAINWDDATDCLKWAEEADATVAAMKAWRRLKHGLPGYEEVPQESIGAELVEGMREFTEALEASEPRSKQLDTTPAAVLPTVSAAARATDEEPTVATVQPEAEPVDRLVRRMTDGMQRILNCIEDKAFAREFRSLPKAERMAFLVKADKIGQLCKQLG